MMTAVSRDFHENKQEMQITPHGVNMFDPNVQQDLGRGMLGGAFGRAVENTVMPVEPQMQVMAPANDGPSSVDADMVGSANLVGDNLADKGQSFQVKSDMSYLLGAACDSVSEIMDRKPSSENTAPEITQPDPAFTARPAPSFGSGMSGM